MSARLTEILERQDALRSELLEIEQITEPTDDDVTRQDTLLTEYDELETERAPLAERAERIERVRTAAQEPANVEPSVRTVTSTRDPFEGVDQIRYRTAEVDGIGTVVRMGDDDVIARAVTALTDYRPRGVRDDALQAAVRTVETVPGAAEHALLHGSPAYRRAFQAAMRAQGGTPFWTDDEHEAMRAALSLTNANGGYTLPTLLDPTLIHTGTASKNPIRQIARVVSGTQNVWHGVSVGNVTSYWTAEAAAMTEGSPALSNPSVTAAKLTAYLTGSYEIFEDSNLASDIPGLIDESFSYTEQDAFVAGSGSGAPRGILTAISGTAGDIVTASTRGTFAYGDLTALHDAMPSRYEDSAVWLANKGTYTTIRGFATGSYGSLFWANLGQDTPPLLIDSPYYKASALSNSTASGTFFMIYGDFSQYLVYDRIGTQVEFVQNVFNSSGLPTGQRGYIAHKRVGGDVTDVNAFRVLKG